MKAKIAGIVLLLSCLRLSGQIVYSEDFNAVPFGAWESNFLGTETNLMNHYVYCFGDSIDERGNNPDGLWINDGLGDKTSSIISFNTSFGSRITSFSLDITTWDRTARFKLYDFDGALVYDDLIRCYRGAFTNPGVYQRIVLEELNGISRFEVVGSYVEGNTSIDNVRIVANPAEEESLSFAALAPVPEPSTYGLLGSLALALLVFGRRLRRARR
jgi:hypothetical protein